MPRLARLKMEIGGEWEINEFETLFSTIRGTYAYFYWISTPAERVDPIVRSQIQSRFWSTERLPERLEYSFYERIPHEGRLKIASIQFASPGWVEIAAIASVLLLVGKTTNVWIKAIDSGIDLLKKIDNFFEERKLKKVSQSFSLSNIDGITIDEARALCFEIGKHLSLTDEVIESMVSLAGNPISALRLMVRLSAEARRVHGLTISGRLILPESPTEIPANKNLPSQEK